MADKTALTLVLGHAASGKSLWAETEALRPGGAAIYVATARAWDEEMRAKIAAHAARRGAGWSLVEAPLDLAGVCGEVGAGEVALVDCATMWLTNLMFDSAEDPDVDARGWEPEAEAWIAAMAASPGRFVVVSNDVGGGVVPGNAMARAFQRAQGALNQRLAAAAGRVVLVTAGLAQVLK